MPEYTGPPLVASKYVPRGKVFVLTPEVGAILAEAASLDAELEARLMAMCARIDAVLDDDN